MSSLYDQIHTWDNLYLGWRKASRGKRGRETAARFEYRLEDNLLQLEEELETRTYCPGPYYSFYIHDPKRRLISAAPFRDRVVHHALCNLIEPLFERRFISDSYANRVGKGTRNRNNPNNRNRNNGFRVIVASHDFYAGRKCPVGRRPAGPRQRKTARSGPGRAPGTKARGRANMARVVY